MPENNIKENERRDPGRVAITTLGCKSNQYDSSAIEDSIIEAGFTLVDFTEPADAYIINTCTVTNRTDSQSRTLIRRVRKDNSSATVIVTGCYASVSPEEIKMMEGVDFVVGNTGKEKIVDCIRKGRKDKNGTIETGAAAPGHNTGTPMTLRAKSASKRTRATLKIQDGCSKACSYCIIPKARGTSRSIGFDTLTTEIETFIEAGFKEIVLTGIHLGDYAGVISGTSPDTPQRADITAVARLMLEKEWKCRFRFSSLDPDEVTDEFIEVLRSSANICNHVHLPLQSGNNTVLKKMNRKYGVERFINRVERLSTVPGISIGTDIITGFPGETKEAFEATCSLLAALPVSYLHIFPYSARAGTPATSYPDTVHGTEIKRRAARLKELDLKKRQEFFEANTGNTAEVLLEKVESVNGRAAGTGKTGNYISVTVTAPDIKPNTLVKVKLSSVTGDAKGMTGEPLGGPEREKGRQGVKRLC